MTRSRPTRLCVLLLALILCGGWLFCASRPAAAAGDAGRERFAIRVGDLTVRKPVGGVHVLPGQDITISLAEPLPGVDMRLRAEAGTVARARWDG